MKIFQSSLLTFALFGSFFLNGCANIQHIPTEISSIEILEYGMFNAEEVKRDFSRNTDFGGVRISKNQKLEKSSKSIAIELGKSIGIKYQIHGSPQGAKCKITYKSIYPSIGLTNPKNDKTTYYYQSTKDKKIGKTYFNSYYFRHDWEAIPGEWIFQILANGKVMAEQKFILTN